MNATAPEARKRLVDMYTAATRVLECLRPETFESFTSDHGMVLQGFVAWNLTIIGEAATILLKSHHTFCMQHPDIPLKESRRLRNRLVHEYDGVDWNTIWEGVYDTLPTLVTALEPYCATPAEEEGYDSTPTP